MSDAGAASRGSTKNRALFSRRAVIILQAIRLLGWALVGLVPAVAIGAWPTWRLAGEAGLVAMAVGVGISLVGSLVGSVVAGYFVKRNPAMAGVYMLGATAVRFFVVISIALAVVLATSMPKAPLLLWVGIGYLAALATETVGLVRLVKHFQGHVTEAGTAS